MLPTCDASRKRAFLNVSDNEEIIYFTKIELRTKPSKTKLGGDCIEIRHLDGGGPIAVSVSSPEE